MSHGPILRGPRVLLRPAHARDRGLLGELLAVSPNAWLITVCGQAVGAAHLRPFAGQSRGAEYEIAIFSPHRQGRGYGTETTQLILEYAFTHLQLDCIGLQVVATNRRAIACYTKCGFVTARMVREGNLSCHIMLCPNPQRDAAAAPAPTLQLQHSALPVRPARITLRKAECSYLGIGPGGTLMLDVEDGALLIRPVTSKATTTGSA